MRNIYFIAFISLFTLKSFASFGQSVDSLLYYYNHDQYSEALRVLQAIDTTQLSGKALTRYYLTGVGVYHNTNHFEQALNFYQIVRENSALTPEEKATLQLLVAQSYIEISDRSHSKLLIDKLDRYVKKHAPDSLFLLRFNMTKILYFDMIARFDTAMQYATNALAYIDAVGDETKRASVYTTIGELFRVNGRNDKAMEYYNKVEVIAKKHDLPIYLAKVYNNQAIVLNQQGDSARALSKLLKSAELAKVTRGEAAAAPAYYNLGLQYIDMRKYAQGFQYLRKVLDMGKNQGYMTAEYYGHLGVGIYYKEKQQLRDAEYHFNKALAIAQKTDNPANIGRIYERMYELYKQYDLYEKALQYYQLNKQIRDSLKLAESRSKLESMEARYQLAQKEKENKNLRLQQARQKLSFFIGGGVILILILIMILLYVTLRNKRRQNRLLSVQKEQIDYKNHQLHQLNEEVSEQKRQLEEMNQIKDSMFSIISHDLRSPLSSVYMLMRMLNEEGIDTNQGFSMVKSLTGEVNQALFLLNNLMTWAHINTSEIKPVPESFKLKPAIEEVLQFFNMDIEQKNLTIDIEIADEISLFADWNMMQLVFKNLVSNAIKFSYQNGKVLINAQPDKNAVTIKVTDHGIGIPYQKISNIFNAGVRLSKGTQQERGGGLGLVIVSRYLELHNGSIEVSSSPDKGTVFIVKLPAKQKTQNAVRE